MRFIRFRLSKPQRELRHCDRLMGALLALLVLGLHVAALAQSIHAKVCPDAATDNHHCAISEFALGQVASPPEPDRVMAPQDEPAGFLFPSVHLTLSRPNLLPPDRGPPAPAS